MRTKEQDALRHRSIRLETPDVVRGMDRDRYRRKNPLVLSHPRVVTAGRHFGDVDHNGYRFRGYQSLNGKIKEAWMSPAAYARRMKGILGHRAKNKRYMANYAKWRMKRPEIRAAVNARARLPENRIKRNHYTRNRCATDPAFAVRRRVKSRLNNALKAFGVGKRWNTMELIGCTIDELVAHLEKQFLSGMTWENRGLWHIDHIVPFCKINPLDIEQLRMVCHYTNLRPLWGTENLTRKYDSVVLPSCNLNSTDYTITRT